MNSNSTNLLSVIVPIYNVEKYVGLTVQSIVNQTYSELEIILVDDGSTDRSGEICDSYAALYPKMKVIHQMNGGLLAARLAGVKVAKGQYITFVDGDDWIAPNMYLDMMSIVDEYDSDVIASGIYRFYDEDNIVSEIPKFDEGFYDRNRIYRDIIPQMLWSEDTNRWNLDPSLCTKIFKKESIYKELVKVQDVDCYYGEDTVVIFPMMLEIDSIYVISECYYYHRQRRKAQIPEYIAADSFFDKTYKVYEYLRREFEDTDEILKLKAQLEMFYVNAICLKKRCYADIEEMLYPIFPFKEIPVDSEVVLYGAGKVGKEYYEQNSKYSFCNIVLWVDQNYQNITLENYEIANPMELLNRRFDYIVIAIDIAEIASTVKNRLLEMGIDEEKIIWHSIKKKTFL